MRSTVRQRQSGFQALGLLTKYLKSRLVVADISVVGIPVTGIPRVSHPNKH